MDDFDYSNITLDQLSRLNSQQRSIVEKRIQQAKELDRITNVICQTSDPDANERAFNALRDMELPDHCEHGNDIWGQCKECQEIDHLLFRRWLNDLP